MDKLIIVVYPLLILLLFWGAKVVKRGEWNEDVLSFQQTKAFLGFLAIIIIFHHISQRTCATWLEASRIHHGLDVFVFVGYLSVAVFFFCSGYGMYTACSQKKEVFFKGYFIRRILPILIPSVLMWLLFFAAEKIRHVKIEPPVWINTYDYIWYIPAIIYVYAVFYLAFKVIKNEKAGMAVLWVGIILYMIGAFFFSPGSWWYNSIHLFGVGVAMAKNKEKRIEAYKKTYVLRIIIYSIVTAVGFAAASYYPQFASAMHKSYNALLHMLLEIPGQIISAYTFVMLILLIGMKVKTGNKLIAILGTFTLEIYLVHPIFVQLFGFSFMNAAPVFYIKNQLLYVLAVIIPTLPIAWVLHKVLDPLRKKR